ncbi:MAG: hypothetical protein M3326_10770 [Actinomycetota bacterium]|nr:hypothetical protein [Actinomycetota bacterium]
MQRRLIATLGVAGLLLAATAGPAAANSKGGHGGGPPAHVVKGQAERLCEKNNGAFIDLGSLAYVCLLPTGATEKEIRKAERLCERQGGDLFAAVGNVAYACVLPGGGTVLNRFVDTGGPGGGLLTGPGGLRLFPILLS